MLTFVLAKARHKDTKKALSATPSLLNERGASTLPSSRINIMIYLLLVSFDGATSVNLPSWLYQEFYLQEAIIIH